MIFFILPAYCGTLTMDDLVERNNLFYKKFTDIPFTGKIDELKINGHMVDGLKNGLWVKYYSNGQLENKINFKNGKPDGIIEFYFDNGQIETKLTYKNGVLTGEAEVYDYNGNLLISALFENFKLINCEGDRCGSSKLLSNVINNLIKTHSKKIEVKPKINSSSYNGVLQALNEIENKGSLTEKYSEVLEGINELTNNSSNKISLTEKDILNQHIKEFWNPPIGAAGAENLIVEIFLELNSSGKVLSAKWVNKGMNTNNAFYIAAANAAMRAVADASPLPLPKDKYEDWKEITLYFDPKSMFGGY